jgi:2-polyprenyl-3-methyl-5-hydroxy-6-metoxy-1,4-benzoquinol methylase
VNRNVRNTRAGLIAEVRDIWDAKAAFWDERMGEGNAFQLQLIGPAVERLLAVRPEEQILDVGCGNGVIWDQLPDPSKRTIPSREFSLF